MRRNTGGFVTISTAAAMMVWAFFGNVMLQNFIASKTGACLSSETPSEKGVERAPEPSSNSDLKTQQAPAVVAAAPAAPSSTRLISYEELREHNRRYRGAIKLCYLRAARRFQLQHNVPSRVNVMLELKSGKTYASVESADRKLAGCIQRVVQQYRFSADLGDQTVTFPVILAR